MQNYLSPAEARRAAGQVSVGFPVEISHPLKGELCMFTGNTY